MKISISRKVVCSRAGGAQGLWGSCPTSWNPREASQQRILGPRPQAAWGGGGGRGPVGQGGAREPRGRPEAASRVQHGQQTPCRATTAVDRAICCSQVAGALESRVCVGIGGFPSQRIGSKVRGIARLTHAKCHWRHGAASELHPARHQPRAPAPHILCVNRLVPREPRSADMGIVGKPRAARMPLAPSGWSPRPLSVPRQLARGLQWGSTTKSGGLRTMSPSPLRLRPPDC
jgi:hypothetical protein